jgi:hypothetical protein
MTAGVRTEGYPQVPEKGSADLSVGRCRRGRASAAVAAAVELEPVKGKRDLSLVVVTDAGL